MASQLWREKRSAWDICARIDGFLPVRLPSSCGMGRCALTCSVSLSPHTFWGALTATEHPQHSRHLQTNAKSRSFVQRANSLNGQQVKEWGWDEIKLGYDVT